MELQMEMQRLKNEIEEEVKKFNELHKKAQQYVDTRGSLLEQESQNSLVQKEIELLTENTKIFKQVGGVLIDQSRKDALTTLSHRIAHINKQIQATSELIKKNDYEQKAMTEKIQKAKEAYVKMSQMMQAR